MSEQPAAFACPVAIDDSFGPWVGHACRDAFDFTLLFEEVILSIPVQSLFVLALLVRVLQLSRTGPKIAPGALRPLKAIAALCLIALQASLVALWATTSHDAITHTRATLATAVLALVASLGLYGLSWLEHERAFKPSSLLTNYLFLSCLLDLARTRTLWLLGPHRTIPIIFTSSLVLRISLLAIESVEKRGLILHDQAPRTNDATRGAFSTIVFGWLMPLLARGYKNNLEVQDLYPLENDLCSAPLQEALAKAWETVPDKAAPGVLFSTVIGNLGWTLWECAIPKLFQIGLTFTQPFLIRRAVELAVMPKGRPYDNWGYGLIGAFVIVYAGLAVSIGQYQWRVSRVATMLRGGIISLIFQESVRLDLNTHGVNPAAAITLVNTDASIIFGVVHQLHEIWSSCVAIAVAIYLIYRETGAASALPLALAIVLMIVAGFVAVHSGKAQALWIAASQERVTTTSKTLGSIKWLKVSGLNDVAFSIIRTLRSRELKISLIFRLWLGATLILLIFCSIWSPILTFCVYAGLAQAGKTTVDVPTVFTAYALLVLLNEPLTSLMLSLPSIAGSLQSFERVQRHINGKKRSDNRETFLYEKRNDVMPQSSDIILTPTISASGLQNESSSSSGSNEKAETHVDSETLPIASTHAIASLEGKFSWAEDSEPTINISEWNIQRQALTMIVGPVGCGKSTLLRALLGELGSFEGSIRTSYSGVAYCDQTPWIPNDTVRNIITGNTALDKSWYQTVVRACDLEQDLRQWQNGDNTRAGSKGISLSGGQKQRLAIARALYSRKEFVILDDVLSALDSATENVIYDNLWGEKGLLRRAEITTLLVSSDQRRMAYADQVVVLNEKGQIEASGPPETLVEILGHPQVGASGNAKNETESWQQEAEATIESAEARIQLLSSQPDTTRRLGDWKVYRLYLKAAGVVAMAIFLVAMAVFGFCGAFPTIWLGWWSTSTDPAEVGNLGKWLGVYVVLGLGAILGAICGIWQLIVVVINRCGIYFHDELLDTVSRAPMSFHSNVDSGVTVNRFSEDLRLIDMELPTAAFGVATSFIALLAQFIIVAVTSRYLAAVLPVIVGLFYVIQHFYLRTSRQLRLLDIELRAPVNTQLIEMLSGLTTIRAFQWEDTFMEGCLAVIDDSQKPLYLFTSLQCWLTYSVDVIVMLIAVAFVALTTTLREQIGASNIGIGLNSVLGLASSSKALLSFWVMLEVSIGAVMRVYTFTTTTETEDASIEPPTDVESKEWPRQGRVDFDDVTASYDTAGACLENVTFSIEPGQKVAICGRTGCGKSSLTLCLLRMLDLDRGSIKIDGIDIANIPHEYVRAKLVALPQEVFILDGSIRLNVDPAATSSDEEILAALEKVQLLNKILARGGLDATVNDDFFSQGEEQLLVFARAMLRKSKVLILDEFTSSLDQKTSKIIDQLLQSWFDGWTIIAVTHDLSAVLDFDKVAVLDGGKLLEFDEPRQLLEQESAFKVLYTGPRQRGSEQQACQ